MVSADLNLVEVFGKKRENLLKALSILGKMDADFCGENGIEYLWNEVWEHNGFKNLSDYEEYENRNLDDDEDYKEIQLKYKSNMEYLLDLLKDKETDKEIIEEFVSRWVGSDSYYKGHVLKVIYDDNGKAKCIALSIIS